MTRRLLFSVFSLLMLASCGGGSGSSRNYVNNKVLDKFPSIYVEKEEEKEEQGLRMRQELEGVDNSEKAMAIMEKYQGIVEQIETNALEMAEKEAAAIKGNAVPFTIVWENPDFEVKSATVGHAAMNQGRLR